MEMTNNCDDRQLRADKMIEEICEYSSRWTKLW